jgi:hypothetical protein
VLAPIMPRIRKFYATISGMIGSEQRDPYGSYEEDSYCFALGDHCFIKLDIENEFVKSIWFDYFHEDGKDFDKLVEAIKAISTLSPSIISDYYLKAVVDIDDEVSLSNYFKMLVE